jgi:triacylglycerol lipase
MWVALSVLTVLSSACRPSAAGSARTSYPIVLAHGILGMESYLGVLDYWFGIVPALREAGASVYVTEVSAIHSSVERGEQLLAQVQQILATSGAAKVNLIGHSEGGIDARYVAGVRPDLVASVTTIGSPHKGSPVAELLATGILDDGTFTAELIDALGPVLQQVLQLLTGTGLPLDARAALLQLAPSQMARFNARFPNGVPAGCGEGSPQAGGVRFFSWTGSSPTTNPLDPTDTAFEYASLVHPLAPNDGFVSVCSAQFGDVIRNDYTMNHLDEIHQMVGLVSPLEVSPISLFLNHASRLRSLGL